MKKNMIYLATGAVFLILALCIAYVFTEPTATSVNQETALQEQDASLLSADKEISAPSADSLVFNAQTNTTAITTPPPAAEESKEENIAEQQLADNPEPTADSPEEKTEETAEETAQQPTAPNNNQKNTLAEQKDQPAVLQDKLPVPFVKDSLKTRSVLEPKKNANTIIYAELMMDGNQVGFVFEGDKPIKPKTFRLNDPDRVVMDIEGYWILKLPRLISNRMVKDIRSNAQKDKTRIVFDLKVPVSSSLLYRIHSRKYQLVFK